MVAEKESSLEMRQCDINEASANLEDRETLINDKEVFMYCNYFAASRCYIMYNIIRGINV